MKNAIEILSAIIDHVAGENGIASADDILNVLKDGAALAALGINDDDQAEVEAAYDSIMCSLEECDGEAA